MFGDNVKAMKYEDDYFNQQTATKIINYFIRKYKETNNKGYLKVAGICEAMYYAGRRESEVIGQKPYNRLPGLRPKDIKEEDQEIVFFIAKKNQVKTHKRLKKGNSILIIPKTKEEIATEKVDKRPFYFSFPVLPVLLKRLKIYISILKPKEDQRIFDIGRDAIDKYLKQCSLETNIRLKGTRRVRFTEGYEIILGKDGKPKKKMNYYYKEIPRSISAHVFRHSFSMWFLDANKRDRRAIIRLRDYLQHSNIAITSSYLHSVKKELREGINNMN